MLLKEQMIPWDYDTMYEEVMLLLWPSCKIKSCFCPFLQTMAPQVLTFYRFLITFLHYILLTLWAEFVIRWRIRLRWCNSQTTQLSNSQPVFKTTSPPVSTDVLFFSSCVFGKITGYLKSNKFIFFHFNKVFFCVPFVPSPDRILTIAVSKHNTEK